MIYTEISKKTSMVKRTSFIEQLSDPQIKAFLYELYPASEGYCCSFRTLQDCDTNESCIMAIVYNHKKNITKNIRLEEFSSNIDEPDRWLKYLSKIFETEFSRAFLKYGCLIPEDE